MAIGTTFRTAVEDATDVSVMTLAGWNARTDAQPKVVPGELTMPSFLCEACPVAMLPPTT